MCVHSFTCSLGLRLSFLSPWGPQGGNISTFSWKQPLLQPLITAGHITATPYFRFIFQSFVFFKATPACCCSFHWFAARGEEKYACRRKPVGPRFQMFLVRHPFFLLFLSRHLSLQLSHRRIFVVLLLQTNIPTVRAVGLPGQVFEPEVSFSDNEKATGCLDTRALAPLSPPHH